MQQTFQVANLSSTPTVLAEMVIRLPPEPATTTTLTEGTT